ncbi:uncharacterized protein LOC121972187 isoform X1 [Zingiber officinale]|uniref:uncharacterized protein LOC121972187 isoform X1 n=1 Tax=Zingiber officinale TaxID=94328 RepID=UPI001C4D96BE|nr:uncharacterized protein LOC121972187 isoform X1 [Zingiber officinale]
MGFKAVFASLQDIFPQIDLRILKAVALEHPNDIDAAAESILVEILPSIATSYESSFALQDANEVVRVSTSDGKGKQPMFYEHQEEERTSNHLSGNELVVWENTVSSHAEKGKQTVFYEHQDEEQTSNHLSGKEPVVWENAISSHGSTSASANTGSPCIVETDARDPQVSLASYSKELEHPASDINVFKELNTNSNSERNVKVNGLDLNHSGVLPSNQLFEPFMDALNDISQEDSDPLASFNLAQEDESPLEQPIIQPSIENSHTEANGMHDNNQTSYDQDSSASASFSYDQHPQLKSLDFDLNSMSKDKIMCDGSYSLNGSLEQSFQIEPPNAQNLSELELDDAVLDCITSGGGVKVCEVDNSKGYVVSKFATITSAFENTHSKCSEKDTTEFISYENGLQPNDDSLPTTLITRSGHFIDIEFLEGMLSDAKGEKLLQESLSSAVELASNLMRDVELLEDRSKHAKEVASNAGQDILSKAEELKVMVVPAKEENDKLAGVIYGEKAILATEAQELQSRLLNLSNERNKSLSVIEEIRETLEIRIAAMKEEIAAAEREKLEKEAAARRVLNEQEAIMASIVEESKKLQEETEKNSKLREFLMDRGRIVDALQGEIAIICEDVMLLKQRVDSGLPSGRSVLGIPSGLSASSSSSHGGCKHSSSDVPVLELEDSTENLSVHDNIAATPSSAEGAKYVIEHSNDVDIDWEIVKDGIFRIFQE